MGVTLAALARCVAVTLASASGLAHTSKSPRPSRAPGLGQPACARGPAGAARGRLVTNNEAVDARALRARARGPAGALLR